MHMAHRAAKWTLSEVHRLPDDGNKYELVSGELFVTPPPSAPHETLASVLDAILQPYVKAQGLGRVYRPRSVIQRKRSEVEPDLTVRPIPATPRRTWRQMPLPILVVEILSPSTRRRDHVHKRDFYMDIGIAEYWIVDDEDRTVRVVRRGVADVVAETTLSWRPAKAAKALVIDVRALFKEALG